MAAPMESTQIECPLCSNPARFDLLTNFGRTKHYECAVCTEYLLTDLAEHILRSTLKWKEANLSAQARRAPQGLILSIERGPAEHNHDVVARLVERSSVGL